MNGGSKHSELHIKLCNMEIIKKITKKKYPSKLISTVLKKIINSKINSKSPVVNKSKKLSKSKLSICFQ